MHEDSAEEAPVGASNVTMDGAESVAKRAAARKGSGMTQTTPDAPGDEVVRIAGCSVKKSDLVKLAGLALFFVIMGCIVWALWPYLSTIFEPGGVDRLIASVQERGVFGVLLLLGLQLVQIVVAFIPGEVVQIAAGMIYGPWVGALVVLTGCVISSAIVYCLVHTLGAPFVRDMISEKHMEKFRHFEDSGRLDIIVFVLFLIPGMPKDVFTYLVPLTDMRLGRFLLLSNTARIPGVLMSTFAANGLMEGHLLTVAIIVGVVLLVMVVAFVFRKRIMAWLHKK